MWIKRICPLCENDDYEIELKIPAENFLSNNITLKCDLIQESGILKDTDKLLLCRCRKCSFVYVPFILNKNFLESYYLNFIDHGLSKEKIITNHKLISNLNISHELLKYSFNKRKDEKMIRVFEFGCGWGDFLSRIRGPGIEVFGCEYDKEKIQFCRTQSIQMTDNISKLDSEKKFNIFVAHQVFEHIDRPKEVMSNLIKILDNDFIGFFSVPNYSDDILQKRKIENQNGTLNDRNLNPIEHLNYFSPQSAYEFLIKFNFQIIDIKTLKPLEKKEIKSTNLYFNFRNAFIR